MPPSPVTFDESLWPLLIIRFEGEFSSQEFTDYLARLSTYPSRGERYVSILDASRVRVGTREQGLRQAAWIKEHEAPLRQWQLGSAHVISSPAIRLVTSLILYLQPLPAPHIVVPRLSEAVAWALGRLEEGGLPLAAQRVRHHFGLLAGKSDQQA
jgi:hypothetical protein